MPVYGRGWSGRISRRRADRKSGEFRNPSFHERRSACQRRILPAALANPYDSSKIRPFTPSWLRWPHPAGCQPALRGGCLVRDGKLRVGIVGVGGIGHDQHLPGWAKVPFAEVIAAADLSEAALARACEY